MNIEYVRYFIAACEYGSILEASKKLYISAQGLGAGIHRLEKSIGIELLDYGYNGVKPTAFGKVFYDQAVIACREAERLEQMAKEYTEKQKQIMTAGTIGSTKFYYCLKSGILQYQESYPDSGLTGRVVVKEDGAELVSDIRTGLIDIGLLFHSTKHDDLNYYMISPPSRIMLLISKDHPLAAKDNVKWEDLKNLQFVFPAPQDPFKNLMNSLCRKHGYTPETVYYSTENSQNARFLDQNFCAMFIRESYAHTILQFCKNTLLRPIEPETSVACSVIWKKNNDFDAERQLFLDEVIKYCSMVF